MFESIVRDTYRISTLYKNVISFYDYMEDFLVRFQNTEPSVFVYVERLRPVNKRMGNVGGWGRWRMGGDVCSRDAIAFSFSKKHGSTERLASFLC
jgi:hypothetical protein